MADLGIVGSIGIMIVAATLVILLARRANVPTIVLYILTGLLLGPVGLDLLSVDIAHDGHAESAVAVVAEIGIVLLLFIVGLELSLEKIKSVGMVAVAAGLGQIFFTAVFGYGASLLLGFTSMEAVFLALALTFSSTVVVVKLLAQKKDMNTLYGRIAVGIFLVQDVVVVLALTFLAGLGEPESMEATALALNLGQAFLGMTLMLVIALFASRFLLEKPMAWIAASAPATLIWSLSWCFAFVVASEWLELSPEIGAFLAGLSLAQLPIAHDLRRRVNPLMNYFIAIFFISLGAQMDLSALTDYWPAIIIFSIFVLIGKPVFFMYIIARRDYSERTSFLTSVTVAQISEFSFIFAALGLSVGLIDESILSLITIVGLITIGASSYMIIHNEALYDWTRERGWLKPYNAAQKDDELKEAKLSNHIIVVGMNAMGRRLVQELCQRGETVLAVDTDVGKLADLPCHHLVGNINYPTVLDDAFLEEAKLVVSTLRIEDTNNLLAYRSRQAGVPIAVHAFDPSVVAELDRLDVDFLIDPKKYWLDRAVEELHKAGVKS